MLKLFSIAQIQGYYTQIIIQKTSCGWIFSNNLFLHVFGSVLQVWHINIFIEYRKYF